MAKRLFAWLLVLTLVLSMMPAITLGVTAVGDLNGHTSHEGWTNWGDEESEWKTLPTKAGKYYLTHDVEMTDSVTISANVDLCLNGHTVRQTTSGARHIYLNEGKGITFNMYDCCGTGSLTGGSMSTGSVINVTRTNTFNMYGGKITGNISTGDAVVYIQAANATRPVGGVFNMYGGEISGNKCKNGVIYGAGGDASYTNSQVNIYGGVIKNNEATASGGAIYVKSYGTLHIENATITGNKAKTAGSAIYAQNNTPITIKNSTITGNIGTSTNASSQPNGWSAAIYTCGVGNQITLSGKVVISGNTTAYADTADISLNYGAGDKLYVNDLAAGSDVVFRTVKADAATADAAIAVATNGSQTGIWQSEWVTYMNASGETKNITYGKDGFYFVSGHYHGDQKFVEWNKTDSLPDEDGEANVGYYLKNDVTITTVDKRSVVDGGGTLHLCLNGKTVTQSIENAGTRENSELIRVSAGSLYLDDCTTVYDKDGYFVSGGKLTGGNKLGNGAALYIHKAASIVEVTGVAFTDNTNTQTDEGYGGAAVMARYNTTPAKFIGCKFADNESTGGAGAIALREGGKVTVEKSVFTGNTAKHGGAVYCTGSTFVAKDCKFTGNTATNAAAIDVLGSSNVTIDSCTITGNSTTSNDGYGAVNLANGKAVVKIQGKSVIFDNLNKDGLQQNVHLQHSTTTDIDYDVSGLLAGSKVGFTLFADRITAGVMHFSTTGMTANPGYCVSDHEAYEVKLNETTTRLELVKKVVTPPETHTHKLCNDDACGAHGSDVAFQPWESNNSLPTFGNYYLTEDVTLSAAYSISDNLNLCLNGKTITQTGSGKRIYTAVGGYTLSITDCETDGQLTGGSATYGSAISVRHNATFNLYAGKITGNTSTSEGTVYIQGGKVGANDNNPLAGIFNMYGGEISGNTTNVGGAISTSAPNGAVTRVPAVNIYGGKITGNTATDGNGGAINTSGTATIYIENAEISGNTAGGEGGAIYATNGSTVTVKDTRIKNNNAKNGAAINAYGGTVTLEDAVIENNHATDKYTAVHVATSGTTGVPTLILKGETVITGNTSGSNNVPMNLFLRNNVMVDVSGLTDAAYIGLTRDSDRAQDRVSTTAVEENHLVRFASDDAEYQVKRDDQGYLVLVPVNIHDHKLCNDAACADHADVDFRKWTDATKLPASGNYYLDVDVRLSGEQFKFTGDTNLCLNGHSITQASDTRVLSVSSGVTVSITDCGTTGKITGGKHDTGSGIFINEGGTLNLFGGTITGNTPKTATGATAGAAIFLRSNDGPGATFNMYGGEISGNGNAGCWGGAISNGSGNANNTVYVNIYGGKIIDNTAGTGGAIRMENNSVTTIYGGQICGNNAATSGGAIYLSKGGPELIIKGGTITDNTAGTGGAGVYVTAGAKVTIEGATRIYDNTVSDKHNNLYLAGSDVITVGNLANTAKIGISAATNNRAITTQTSDYTANFVADNSRLSITFKENALWLEKIETYDHFHCICDGVKNDVCDHSQQKWVKWGDDPEELSKLPTTAGYYYLVDDIQLAAVQTMTEDQDIYICLNGKTVTAAQGKRHIATANGTTLSITDCSAQPGGFTGGNSNYGGSVNVVSGSTFNLFRGCIYGNTAPDNEGGGVYIQGGALKNEGQRAGGIFNMYGGEIYGNTAAIGAGVRAAGLGEKGEIPSQIHIYGGSIHDNKAVYKVSLNAETGEEEKTHGLGGGVAMTASTKMTVSGGTITNNTAESNGGGIYMQAKSTLTIQGGKMSGNTSVYSYGGAIFATGNGTIVTMDGGELSGNTAKSGGAVMLQTRALMTMNGGKISGNNTTGNGAGLYVSTNTDFVMNDGTISGNTSNATGAGFYALRSRVTLNGGTITGNKAANRAGGFGTGGGTIVVNGVTISGNEAKEGGATYINRTSATSNGETVYYPSNVTINEGALITGNKAQTNCGGVLCASIGTVVTMNGGEISKNTAENGGGIMTWSESTFVLKGGKITGNKVTSGGGGAYISTNSHFKMEGGSISGNTAKTAGGIYFLRSDADLTGGSISNNTARYQTKWSNGKETKSGGTGGGIYISGARVNFKGTNVTGNYSDVNGGGIMMGRATYKEDGVTKREMVKINVYGGIFSGNKTDGSGGAMLMQSEGTVVNMYGGTFTGNNANNGAAIYVSTKTTFNMTGGSVMRNTANNIGGGIYVLKSTANITGGQIHSNSATTNSGQIMVNGDTAVLKLKDMKIHDGTAKTAGAMVVQSKGRVIAENCHFYDNKADGGIGAAIYVSNKSFGDFTDCKFYNNSATQHSGAIYSQVSATMNITRCDFTENTAGTMAGAIYTNPRSVTNITDSTFSKNVAGENGGALVCRGTMYLTNVTIENNSAANGGAIATDTNNASGAGVTEGLVVKNCEIRNNTATTQGGAFYIWKGRPLKLYDSEVTDNTAGAEGGAIWAYEDVQLHNAKITDNHSGGEGYAVYMNDANYDGHSYYTSKNKLSGNTIIKDNEGGNLWMGPDVVFVVTPDGLGEDVHIQLVLDSGVVTNRILGAYHYEGGDQVYTITYGDRSMTDPEYDASLIPSDDEGQANDRVMGSPDILLYAGIGILVIAITAVIVLILMKKKKAGKPAQEATKE